MKNVKYKWTFDAFCTTNKSGGCLQIDSEVKKEKPEQVACTLEVITEKKLTSYQASLLVMALRDNDDNIIINKSSGKLTVIIEA